MSEIPNLAFNALQSIEIFKYKLLLEIDFNDRVRLVMGIATVIAMPIVMVIEIGLNQY